MHNAHGVFIQKFWQVQTCDIRNTGPISALLPNPNHTQKQSLPLFYSTSPNDHFQKLNHKPSNADGTHEENPFNMNFNKMESDANYGKLKAMKGNILSLNHILESGLSQHILLGI